MVFSGIFRRIASGSASLIVGERSIESEPTSVFVLLLSVN
jgi:hypothetical protein